MTLKGYLYLFIDRCLVDSVPDDVHSLEHADGEGLECPVLHYVRIVHVQIGEDSLCQRVALQPCYLKSSAKI